MNTPMKDAHQEQDNQYAAIVAAAHWWQTELSDEFSVAPAETTGELRATLSPTLDPERSATARRLAHALGLRTRGDAFIGVPSGVRRWHLLFIRGFDAFRTGGHWRFRRIEQRKAYYNLYKALAKARMEAGV